MNKHSESIAEAKHVPYRPKQISKGHNYCKSWSNTTKVKLDLYYLKTNSYIKFHVNITKDNGKKSGKPSGCTDRRTDKHTD